MATIDYSDFEMTIIRRIRGIIDRGLVLQHSSTTIAEEIYLAWPEISKRPNASDSNDTIPERY